MQGHVFANRFSRDWSLLEEEKERLGCYPCDQQEGAGRDSEHQERAETVVVRLSAQGASFFHTRRLHSLVGISRLGWSTEKSRRIRQDRLDMIQKLCQEGQSGAKRMALDYNDAEKPRTDRSRRIVAIGHLRRHTALTRQASRKPYLPPVFLKPDIL